VIELFNYLSAVKFWIIKIELVYFRTYINVSKFSDDSPYIYEISIHRITSLKSPILLNLHPEK
jgi:hypothetical protein